MSSHNTGSKRKADGPAEVQRTKQAKHGHDVEDDAAHQTFGIDGPPPNSTPPQQLPQPTPNAPSRHIDFFVDQPTSDQEDVDMSDTDHPSSNAGVPGEEGAQGTEEAPKAQEGHASSGASKPNEDGPRDGFLPGVPSLRPKGSGIWHLKAKEGKIVIEGWHDVSTITQNERHFLVVRIIGRMAAVTQLATRNVISPDNLNEDMPANLHDLPTPVLEAVLEQAEITRGDRIQMWTAQRHALRNRTGGMEGVLTTADHVEAVKILREWGATGSWPRYTPYAPEMAENTRRPYAQSNIDHARTDPHRPASPTAFAPAEEMEVDGPTQPPSYIYNPAQETGQLQHRPNPNQPDRHQFPGATIAAPIMFVEEELVYEEVRPQYDEHGRVIAWTVHRQRKIQRFQPSKK